MTLTILLESPIDQLNAVNDLESTSHICDFSSKSNDDFTLHKISFQLHITATLILKYNNSNIFRIVQESVNRSETYAWIIQSIEEEGISTTIIVVKFENRKRDHLETTVMVQIMLKNCINEFHR